MSQTIVTDRQLAIQEAQRLLTIDLLILDTETTGLESGNSIVEIALINLAGQPLFQSLIHPESPMTAAAQAIHHISAADLEQAPRFAEVWLQIQPLLERPFASYNLSFDLRLIAQTAYRAKVQMPVGWTLKGECCLMELYATFWGEERWDGGYRWQSLADACRQQQIQPGNHRALSDAQAALAVLKAIANSKSDDEPPF